MTNPARIESPAGVVSKRDVLEIGMTYKQVRNRIQRGDWERLARGQYTRTDEADSASRFDAERAEHARRAIAAQRNRPGSVISHRSAAILHGLPLVSGIPEEVEINRRFSGWDGHDQGVHVHDVQLEPHHALIVDGVPITSLERTFFDVAACGFLPDALAVADAILRASPDLRLPAFIASLPKGLRGIRTARRAAQHASGLRESPLESWSFADFIDWGIPLPACQAEIVDEAGGFIARVDFLWRRRDGRLLIGECDGALKYETTEAIYAEKRREDSIRAQSHDVVRWGWADLRGGGELLRHRLRRALAES